MNESLISVRYCRALFQSALDSKNLDKVNQDMVLILEVFKTDEAKEFLKSPIIVPSKKMEIFHKMFGANLEKITLSLIDLLVKNGRESFLPGIARVFIHQTLTHKGITRSTLTTAVKADEKIKNEIISIVSGKFSTKIELDEVVDPAIIGGFILRVDDKYIDASIKTKLNKIRKELSKSPVTSD